MAEAPEDERPTAPRGTPRRVGKLLLAAGATAAAGAAVVAAERYRVARARSRPDPARAEPRGERPGIEHRVASFDGTKLAVNVVGPDDAPTLLFAHGLSLDMTTWHYQWKELRRRYRCVLYDQRGHGRSDRAPDGDYTVQALGGDLHAVLEEVAPAGPVGLVGHSMGGMSILAMAEAYPELFGDRVRAVVLSNMAAGELVKELAGGLGTRAAALLAAGVRRAAKHPERAYRIRSRAFAREANLAFLVAWITNFTGSAPPSLIEHVIGLAATTPLEVWSGFLPGLLDMDLRDAIRNLDVPTLVLVGDLDRVTPPSSARAFERALPDGRLVVLEGAGHCMMLEHHGQWNRTVGPFLDLVLARAEP